MIGKVDGPSPRLKKPVIQFEIAIGGGDQKE